MATSRRGVLSRLTLEMLVCRTWAALERDATLHPSHHRRERSSQAPLPGRRRPGLPPATRRIGRLSSVPPPPPQASLQARPRALRGACVCMWGGWVGAKGVVSWARRRGVVGQKLSRRERRRGCRGVKEKGERRRSPFPPFSITGGKTRGPGGRGKTEGVRCRARSRRCVCCCSARHGCAVHHDGCARHASLLSAPPLSPAASLADA